MNFRAAKETDFPIVIYWVPDAEACAFWAGPFVNFPLTIDSLGAEIDYAPENSFCLEEGGVVVAFGQIFQKDEGRLHLARFIVDPSFRGKGFGMKMCEIFIEKAAILKCQRVSLYVYKHNTIAVNLYKGLGFEEQEKPDEYELPDDICYMVLELKV